MLAPPRRNNKEDWHFNNILKYPLNEIFRNHFYSYNSDFIHFIVIDLF